MGSYNSKNKNSDYLLETLNEHEDSINCIAVSEDRSLLATASEDKTIRMWSVVTEPTDCLGVLR